MPHHLSSESGFSKGSRKDAVYKKIEVVLADRHPLFQIGLLHLLEQTPDIDLIEGTGDADEALYLVRELEPDILLLGMNLPAVRSIKIARELYEGKSSVCILVLFACEEEPYISELFPGMVTVCIRKEEHPKKLIKTIRMTAKGISLTNRDLLAENMPSRSITVQKLNHKHLSEFHRLSKREQKILQLVGQGCGNEQIAEKLFISPHTVKNHITNIYSKLNITSRSKAVAWVWQHGLLVER